MRVLSWGCGVQSTTLGEMSAQGVLDPLDAIITADTGWERQATYEARDYYTRRWRSMGQQVEIVSGGDVRRDGTGAHAHIPFWTNEGGALRRKCTGVFKIEPVKHRIRELAGYERSRPPHPPVGSIELWLGISLDEWHRAKPSRVKFIRHRWPLLEEKLARGDCINWLATQRLPVPPKSACVCCPYRQASEWLIMKEQSPDEFADAVRFDEEIRHHPMVLRGANPIGALYIWKKGGPLAEAPLEFWAERERVKYGTQIPMMLCESGYCWV